MNILYVDPVVHSETAQTYQYYNGLFDAFSEIHTCELFSNKVVKVNELLKSVKNKPDVIVFGMGWNDFEYIKGLKDLSIPKIGFVFKPQNKLNEKMKFFKQNGFSLLLTSLPDPEKYQELSGISCKRMCYAIDPKVFYDNGTIKKYTIGFSGALHQNKIYSDGAMQGEDVRKTIQEQLFNVSDVKCFLNGSDSVSPRIKSYDEYATKIRESLMWFATPAAFGDITPRYFEVPTSGTLLLCSKVPSSYKDIFRDGETCIEFKEDGSNFMEKFKMCKNDIDLVKTITDNTKAEFSENHTWHNRALEIIKMVNDLTG